MPTSPISLEKRKQILRVIFISLLLDLVCLKHVPHGGLAKAL